MIRLLHWNTSLWPIILGQAGLAAWLIWRTMDAMRIVSWRGRMVAAAIIAVSSLPFFVIWVMADVLTALLVLGAFVAVARPPTSKLERALLVVFLLGAGSAHVTHLPLMFGIGIVLLAATFLWRDLGLSRAAALGITAAPVLLTGLLLAANYTLFGVVRVTYSSPVLALCRQVEDGLTQRTLDAECPVRGWQLCNERAALEGATSPWFSFGAESPLQYPAGRYGRVCVRGCGDRGRDNAAVLAGITGRRDVARRRTPGLAPTGPPSDVPANQAMSSNT